MPSPLPCQSQGSHRAQCWIGLDRMAVCQRGGPIPRSAVVRTAPLSSASWGSPAHCGHARLPVATLAILDKKINKQGGGGNGKIINREWNKILKWENAEKCLLVFIWSRESEINNDSKMQEAEVDNINPWDWCKKRRKWTWINSSELIWDWVISLIVETERKWYTNTIHYQADRASPSWSLKSTASSPINRIQSLACRITHTHTCTQIYIALVSVLDCELSFPAVIARLRHWTRQL